MDERDIVSGMAVFVAIVETGSFAAAARRSGLSASAVSKQVTRLEERLGAALLRRTTRSMTLTDAGRAFYERAQGVLEQLRATEQELASEHVQPRGSLRVSASLMLGQTRVVPIVLGFLEKTPAVSMDLELTDRTVDLVGERVDVAVRITAEPPLSLVAKRVGAIRRVLCASPAYLRKRPAPRTPTELEAHACLTLSTPSASPLWTFSPRAKGAEQERVRVAPRLRVSNTVSLRAAALSGLGIAELPDYLVEEDLAARRLVRLLGDFDSGERGVYVVYAGGPLVPARVRAFVNHLVPGLEAALSTPSKRKATR